MESKIICGDAMAELKKIDPVDVVITDPVWPNALKSMQGHDDPFDLFQKAAIEFPRLAKTVVVHLGCVSDPRFLSAIPVELPFLRTCWLRYNFPSFRGRILIGSDVAYAFGLPPKSRQGNHLLPGECITGDSEMKIIVMNKKHPCSRKINHVRWLVNVFSNPGDTILDPFMGSGTTGIACIEMRRKFIGIEIDKSYFKIAKERITEAERQAWLFDAENKSPLTRS